MVFILGEVSRWLGTDEVAPLVSGGEEDLRLPAVPQGRGLRHGGRSRGRFHDDLWEHGGDNVRRLGRMSPTVSRPF